MRWLAEAFILAVFKSEIIFFIGTSEGKSIAWRPFIEARYDFFNDMIGYDSLSEESMGYSKIRGGIRIIDNIRYPLI